MKLYVCVARKELPKSLRAEGTSGGARNWRPKQNGLNTVPQRQATGILLVLGVLGVLVTAGMPALDREVTLDLALTVAWIGAKFLSRISIPPL